MDSWMKVVVVLLLPPAVGCGGKAVVDPTGSGGAGAASHNGGWGGTASGTGGCGDPEVMAAYQSCLQADDQATCEAAGGTWDIIGLAPYEECQCPTGQSSCPCTTPSQCLSSCVAPTSGGVFECDGVVEGHCSGVSITVGCLCFFDETGQPQGICVD